MKAQAVSLPFTSVFAALVSIINTKLPMMGELLLHRLISQFRRAFKRNDKVRQIIVVSYVNLYPPFQTVCHSTMAFIAHLVNQGIAHKLIVLQILVLHEGLPTVLSTSPLVSHAQPELSSKKTRQKPTQWSEFPSLIKVYRATHRCPAWLCRARLWLAVDGIRVAQADLGDHLSHAARHFCLDQQTSFPCSFRVPHQDWLRYGHITRTKT